MSLRSAFNKNPGQYDRSRPRYPADIFDRINRYAHIDRSSEILEIGCGTGIATELFAGSGAEIDCIDIGKDLLQIAKLKFSGFPNISFFNSEFESFEPGKKYDLIFSATAYHWIRQPEGDKITKSLLKENGIFAVFRYVHTNINEGFFRESQSIYSKYFPGNVPKYENTVLINISNFKILKRKEYPWSIEHSSDEYINLISTYSDNLSLPAEKRKAFFAELKDLIDTRFKGKVKKKYVTVLEIARPQ